MRLPILPHTVCAKRLMRLHASQQVAKGLLFSAVLLLGLSDVKEKHRSQTRGVELTMDSSPYDCFLLHPQRQL